MEKGRNGILVLVWVNDLVFDGGSIRATSSCQQYSLYPKRDKVKGTLGCRK